MSEKPSQSPESVELKSPDEVKKLTPEQQNEIKDAQKQAAVAAASERLAILQQRISASTQEALKQQNVEMSTLAEEKGILNKA